MEKNFDGWNRHKKKIDCSDTGPDFHEREIWWCSIGVNIGSEQHSQTSDFSRPVLVVKKFTRTMFWGIPLTTKIKNLKFRHRLKINDLENDLLILQMRAYDNKRLIRKIDVLAKDEFSKLMASIKNFLPE